VSVPEARWPAASLDPLRRAKVIGAAIPGSAWVEGVLDAPYDVAWPWVTDLATSVPRFDVQVRRIDVRDRWLEEGTQRMRIVASGTGLRLGFDVWLEDGFCLMRGRRRLYVVVMAARPEDGGARTRFVHLEGVPLPGARVLRGVLRRVVRADFRKLAQLAANGF
jgi:hypothetical protein